MEVERLTATLDASGLAGFTAAMGAADKATGSVSSELRSLAAIAKIADAALAGVKITSGQAAETDSALAAMKRSVSGVTAVALAASDALNNVELGPAQAATTEASAAQMVASLQAVKAQVDDLRRSVEGLGAANAASGAAGAGGGLLAALGWGGGGNFRVPFTGVGFGGMAAFGSLLGLAGFGMEHVITSGLGILGSIGGGVAGGGLLGLGALGTSAVGMGTDMAGIGQAANDIKLVSGGLSNLQQAIQVYGRDSQQAAQAQAQLNADLASFSATARGAVLQAAQTRQGFKQMFDQATGAAERTGAEIITQAMQVGEHFLPTIGQFASQNMGIIQQQLQPLFAWLQNPAFNGPGMGGGLGIFTNLEQVFQRNLPSAVQAGSQALEFFVRTVDVAAQQTGGLMAKLDEFFTRMNQPSAFAGWASEVNKLIGLFRTWMGLAGALIGLVVDLFKPAVGFGQAFAQELTNIISQVRTWLSLSSTQAALHGLFDVHLVEVIRGLGGVIQALLPPVEAAASLFLRLETIVSGIAAGALRQLADVIDAITRIPFASDIIGWAAALTLVFKANQLLFGMLGRVTGLLPAEATETETLTASMDGLTAAVDRLVASFAAVGPAPAAAGAATAAAAGTADAALITWQRAANGAMVATVEAGASGGAAGGGLLAGGLGRFGTAGLFAGGGLLAGSLASSLGAGQGVSRALDFAGLGAAAGSIVPGVGTLLGAGVGAGLGAVAGYLTTIIHEGPSATEQLQKLGLVLNSSSQLQIAQARAGQQVAEQAVRNAQAEVQATRGTSQHAQAVYDLATAQQNLASQTSQLTDLEATQQKATSDLASKLDQVAQAAQNATTPISFRGGVVLDTTSQKLQVYIQRMQQLAQSLQASDPKLAQVIRELTQIAQATDRIPTHKTIRITLEYGSNVRVGPNGDLFPAGPRSAFGGSGGTGHHSGGLGPRMDVFQLPQNLQVAQAKANYSGSQAQIRKVDTEIKDWVEAMLRAHRFVGQAVVDAYNELAALKNTGKVNVRGVPRVRNNPYGTGQYQLLPAGLQSAMLQAQTRVDLSGASTASGSLTPKQLAALKQLEESDKRALDWLDKQHATGQKLLELERERQQVAQQLAQTEQQIAQAMGTGGYVNAQGGFQLPLAVQLAMAKADALAALIPGAQGLTPAQMKLALQVKAAVMRAINSHRLTMQGLIDAWNEIATINGELAQSQGMIDTYHAVASHSITDAIKGLTQAQKIQLDERISQAEAHRGHAPNGPAVLGEPVRPGRKHPLHHGGGGGGRSAVLDAAGSGGGITINGDVYVNADTKKELYRELDRRDRTGHARRGTRR